MDAGLLVAIFLPTVGLCLILCSVWLFYVWRRRKSRRSIRLTGDPPHAPTQRYVLQAGKLVPAAVPPRSSANSRPGWRTPTRASRFFTGVSDRTDVPSIPDALLPTWSRPTNHATVQPARLSRALSGHGRPQLVSVPDAEISDTGSSKTPSLRIQTSLFRASQLHALLGSSPSETEPLRPFHERRRLSLPTSAPSSPPPTKRNLRGRSFLDPPSEEVLGSFLDPPSDEPPRQAPPTPAYQSPLQSRFYIPPTNELSRLSLHTSRRGSRQTLRRFNSISSVSQSHGPYRPRGHSRDDSVSSLSSEPEDPLSATVPQSPASFYRD